VVQDKQTSNLQPSKRRYAFVREEKPQKTKGGTGFQVTYRRRGGDKKELCLKTERKWEHRIKGPAGEGGGKRVEKKTRFERFRPEKRGRG